jgi:hypothetical protein
MTLLTTTDELQELSVALANETFVALDTEFMRDRTYFPKLCLIQLAGDKRHATIDLLAPGIDATGGAFLRRAGAWRLALSLHGGSILQANRNGGFAGFRARKSRWINQR